MDTLAPFDRCELTQHFSECPTTGLAPCPDGFAMHHQWPRDRSRYHAGDACPNNDERSPNAGQRCDPPERCESCGAYPGECELACQQRRETWGD